MRAQQPATAAKQEGQAQGGLKVQADARSSRLKLDSGTRLRSCSLYSELSISRAFFCTARCFGFMRQARMLSSRLNSTIVVRLPSSAKKPWWEMYPGMD